MPVHIGPYSQIANVQASVILPYVDVIGANTVRLAFTIVFFLATSFVFFSAGTLLGISNDF